MAVNLQLRAAPNVNENSFSIEEFLQLFSIATPLGHVLTTNFGGGVGFNNIFGPTAGFTFCLVIPDPNYPGTYQLKGPSSDTGPINAGVSMFPCIPQPALTPTFGLFISGGAASGGFNWTFMFL